MNLYLRSVASIVQGRQRGKITTVTLCPGTFDSVFGGFLSPLLESLAPKMPSPTLATPSDFPLRPILFRFMLPKIHNN